jgi:hypothetical protein
MLTRLTGGTIYDPANGVDGEVRGRWRGSRVCPRRRIVPRRWTARPSPTSMTSPGGNGRRHRHPYPHRRRIDDPRPHPAARGPRGPPRPAHAHHSLRLEVSRVKGGLCEVLQAAAKISQRAALIARREFPDHRGILTESGKPIRDGIQQARCSAAHACGPQRSIVAMRPDV